MQPTESTKPSQPPPTDAQLQIDIHTFLLTPINYAHFGNKIKLRKYQENVITEIYKSVLYQRGYTFVVMFPRQSGKNELQSHLESYLLTMNNGRDVDILKFSPTWKPQSINAMRRLERVLSKNPLTADQWSKESGYIFRVGRARCTFLSAGPDANIAGATANLLLEVDEAQDVSIAKYDRDIAPMAASTNATKVFWGTAWTSHTLLARELRAAEEAEKEDGHRHIFCLTADDVSMEVRAYRRYVAGQVARLGRNHPMIKTQYFSEEVDSETGMFNAARLALMQSDRPFSNDPIPGRTYAFLLDLAGQDESVMQAGDEVNLSNPGRDAATLSIVEVDLSSLELLKKPTYRIVGRRSWTGLNHLSVFGQVNALAAAWRPQWFVIDATGVGEGMWALLDRQYPGRVVPVKFSQAEKSEIGWQFIAVIETGRFHDCSPSDVVRIQYQNCTSTILPGPAHTLRWSVPDGTRDSSGNLVHDDHVLADALVAVLDRMDWSLSAPTIVVPRADPLKEMDGEY